MKVIVFTNASGGVSVITPSPQCGLTIEEIADKDVPKYAHPYLILDESKLPNREYRDLWTLDDNKVIIRLDKALDKAQSIGSVYNTPEGASSSD